VHASDSPVGIVPLLEQLRPGDIYCHAYHELGESILNSEGVVRKEVWDARKRGVLFELAHGKTQCSLEVERLAVRQGFFPDIISTDYSAFSRKETLTYVMSELLAQGMPLKEILRAVTENPGRLIWPELLPGLSVGKKADIAVIRTEKQTIRFTDQHGNSVYGKVLLRPVLTMCGGMIVHRAADFYDFT